MPTMTPEQWQRVRELVDQALERPVDERRAYIKSACGDDAELCTEALRLLRNHERVAEVGFLERSESDEVDGSRSETETPIRSGASTGTFRVGPPTMQEDGSGGDGSPSRSSSGRFEIIKQHARGGLGVVFAAKDCELDREVALKEIQDCHADDPQSRERFTREAEITGRLEHPGIVPVYGFGRHADGRPYYAMRMVKGESLKAAIKAFHAKESQDRDLGERTLELRKLLGQFIDVCQAIDYAHSRGVIHRDIKPDNILLGKYGETLVVDWGLAKAVGKEERAEQREEDEEKEATLRPRSTEDGYETAHGYALGTPEFMSPEQASGWLDKVGFRSDIYSLGATLYCLLTGRPPVTGACADEIIDKARRGAWQPARQVNPRVPRPLDAICSKAMAIEPDVRYESARALADDIEHYLAYEPVAAHSEGWVERLGRWSRHHRAWVGAGMATLLLIAAVSTFAAIRINTERQEKAKLAVSNARLAADERAAQEKASEALGESLKYGADIVPSLSQELDLVPGSGAAQRRLVTLTTDFLDHLPIENIEDREQLRSIADTYISIADMWGNPSRGNLGDSETALRTYGQAITIFERIGGSASEPAVDQRALSVACNRYSDLLLKLGKTGEALQHARRSLTIVERLAQRDAGTQAQRDLKIAHHYLANTYEQMGDSQMAKEHFAKAIAISEQLVTQNPKNFRFRSDLANDLISLGSLERDLEEPGKAIERFHRAIAIRTELLADRPNDAQQLRDQAISYVGLGKALRAIGKLDDALATFENALATRRELAKDSENVRAQFDVATTLAEIGYLQQQLGNLEGAENRYEESRKISEQLQQRDLANVEYRRSLVTIYQLLGDLYRRQGGSERAETMYQLSLDASKKLVRLDPLDTDLQKSLVAAYIRQGDIEIRRQQSSVALETYGRLFDAAKRLIDLDSKNPSYQRNVFLAHTRLGDTLEQMGRFDKAREHFDSAFEISERLATADPDRLDYRRDLTVAHERLGNLARTRSDMDDALRHYEVSLEISREIATAVGHAPADESTVTLYLGKIGSLHLAAGKIADARKSFEEALEISERLAAAHASDDQLQRSVSVNYVELGDLEQMHGGMDAATNYYTRAATIRQRLATRDPANIRRQMDMIVIHQRLGMMQSKAGDESAALRTYQEMLGAAKRLVEADPNNSMFQRNLSVGHNQVGDALLKLDRADEAISHFEAGFQVIEPLVTANPQNRELARDLTASYKYLGDGLVAAGRPEEALAKYTLAIENAKRLVAQVPQVTSNYQDLYTAYMRSARTWKAIGEDEDASVSSRVEAWQKASEHYRRVLDVIVAKGPLLVDLGIRNAKQDIVQERIDACAAAIDELERGEADQPSKPNGNPTPLQHPVDDTGADPEESESAPAD